MAEGATTVNFYRNGAAVQGDENPAPKEPISVLDAILEVQVRKRARRYWQQRLNDAEDELTRIEGAYDESAGAETDAAVELMRALERES